MIQGHVSRVQAFVHKRCESINENLIVLLSCVHYGPCRCCGPICSKFT
jgi:hypothetical protein